MGISTQRDHQSSAHTKQRAPCIPRAASPMRMSGYLVRMMCSKKKMLNDRHIVLNRHPIDLCFILEEGEAVSFAVSM